MANEYWIKQLNAWLEDIERANTTLAYIGDNYSGGIDYEDEAGECKLTCSDMDDLFHLLTRLEDALKSEIKYESQQ